MIVVIDDERTFDTEEDVVYLRTADEAIAWFAKRWVAEMKRPFGTPIGDDVWFDEIWFDHDLGENSQPATEVALFIRALCDINQSLPIRKIFVHSQNPVGAERLMSILKPCSEARPVRCGLPALKTI